MNTELARLMTLAEEGRHQEVEAWARPRAEQGNSDAQFILGHLVYTGAPMDFASACEWLRRAAAQDHPEALYELSQIDESMTEAHSTTPRNDTMRARLRRAAELGSERAQHELGVLLARGRGGFAKDEPEARLWYERAARAGHLRAQAGFGLMCLQGQGGPALVTEGTALLEKVAATDLRSDPWAPTMVRYAAGLLCQMYEQGLWGAEPNSRKAAAARGRLAAAQQILDRRRADDDSAVGRDAEGQVVKRTFAFANPTEARIVLAAHMDTFRRRSYADLVGHVDRNLVARIRGPSNLEYEASVRIHWNDQPNGSISVGGSIEDAGWCTYKTISEFFSLAPDGTVSNQ